MASLKKINKTKRGNRDNKILARRHKKAKQYSAIQDAQVKLLDSLAEQLRSVTVTTAKSA
jgi:hypothetical protein